MQDDVRSIMQNPFGEVACEFEVRLFKEHYSDYFFLDAPCNADSIEPQTYLIIGRRGSGKTSLARFFTFQGQIKNARCISVDEPALYSEVLHRLADQSDLANEVAIPKIRKIWEYLIWTLLFQAYGQYDPNIEALPNPTDHTATKPSRVIRSAVERLISGFLDERDGTLDPHLDDYLSSSALERLKLATKALIRNRPVFVTIDTLEHYSVDNPAMMRSVAGLVSAASGFNEEHSADGVHVKLFLPAEVFTHLWEQVVENPGKHVRSPLFLHWRPRDLIRLVCWRFYHYLVQTTDPDMVGRHIEWDKFSSVKEAVWTPHFGSTITNHFGVTEESFAYVLRHTQMRPRQLVQICNEIASHARRKKTFPQFDAEVVHEALRKSNAGLAVEVLNAYRGTYPNVASIVNALVGMPRMFQGKELDRVAPRTASQWQHARYSPLGFRELVAELGIVGKVRKYDSRSGIVEADFEYSLPGRLSLQVDDQCVIHPMFYERLQVKRDLKAIVYPFPDTPDFSAVQHAATAR